MTPTPEPAGGFSRQLAAIMRPELPRLADEIMTEIRGKIPEYSRPAESPYGHALQVGVEQALTTFVDLIANPSAPREHRDRVCRRLGEYEAREGRSLDSLQAAYRVGAHLAWRRVMEVGQRASLSSAVMSRLADAVFRYMDELAAQSVAGYQAASARSAEAVLKWRRRLLGLILERPAAPYRAITDLAELAGWTVPEQVTMVAILPGRRPAEPPPAEPPRAESPPAEPPPAGDLLADLTGPAPHLLIPGRLDAGRRRMLADIAADGLAAVGLTVPIASAADSLRWARRALALADTGIIGDRPLALCEDHLVTLCLLSDSALVGQLASRQLAALAGLSQGRRRRLTDTLSAWLETRGTAAEMADRLQLHPQTVRYRIRQLEQVFGSQLGDPDARFGTELALRAIRLIERSSPAGAGASGTVDPSEEVRCPRSTDRPAGAAPEPRSGPRPS